MLRRLLLSVVSMTRAVYFHVYVACAKFKGFAQLCLCRRVRIRNFVSPALVTAFSRRALLCFDVFKLRRVLVLRVPNKTLGRLHMYQNKPKHQTILT